MFSVETGGYDKGNMTGVLRCQRNITDINEVVDPAVRTPGPRTCVVSIESNSSDGTQKK